MNVPIFTDLAGKIALVTGSTRGIGAGLANALEDAGMRVLRHGTGAHPEGLADKETIYADLSDSAGCESLANAVRAKTEVLDLLVNNAGFEAPNRLENLDQSALARTLNVNLAASLLLTQALLPLLRRASAPSVINITSIHDAVPYAGNVAYVASKAALEAATRTMALELAPQRIRVNSIAPGAIETDMNREVIEQMGRENFNDWIPLGRVGVPADLAAPLLFLASSCSSYLTGTRLLVDGGYSLALLRYGLSQ
ncbi:MAG: SDR family oxidoreductase [Propionibacteriaceae bacterium]|jgi:NAD(P)-dependent dehydrogenase (short-subunit alcohol dehydrogenase family)|nr:SDR family oxidoreductase [Propionibacteriaceae bacterium]